jgi:outer membrane lipoprotein-sorting protein
MRPLKPVLALLLAAAAVPAASAADLLAATLARMDRTAAGFRSLSADIRRVSHVDVINEDTVDTGSILVKRLKPRDIRYLVDFQSPPNPKKVLLSGHTVQIYYPNGKRVEEYDLGKSRGAMDKFLLLGFGSNSKELESAYSIKLGGAETVAGQKTTRIDLTPRSQDVAAQITKVQLWISDADGIALQQKLFQPGGDYSLATYTNMKVNPQIADTALKLDLPRDVQRQRPQR